MRLARSTRRRSRRSETCAALAWLASAAGCALAFQPAAPRPAGDVVPVALVSSTDWTIVVVANRDLHARRFAWAPASAPPCQAGVSPVSVSEVRLVREQRLELVFPKGDQVWPFADGPTALDVEEIRPEGTACHRVAMTGPEPAQQWRIDRRWMASMGVSGGPGIAPGGDDGPYQLPWSVDTTVGLGRWLGAVRLDGSLVLGSVGCSGCVDGRRLVRTSGGLGAGVVIWQGARHAIELSAAYRLTNAFVGDTSLTFNGGRVGLAWGRTPPPIIGLQWDSARVGFGGVEIYAEWLQPTDARFPAQLMLGIGLVGRATVF